MIIPIRRLRVTIRLLANSVAYPFLMATPDTTYPMAFNNQNTGMEITLMIKGPMNGIMPTNAPRPTKSCVKILITKVANKMIFLSMP